MQDRKGFAKECGLIKIMFVHLFGVAEEDIGIPQSMRSKGQVSKGYLLDVGGRRS